MSQAGRYAHEQNTKRHAQRGFNQPRRQPAETIETATWMGPDMDFCRELAARYDNSWTITQFVAHRSIDDGVSTSEAERRLRYLSQIGFLRMFAIKDDGRFIDFGFSMVNINLPK